MGKNIFYAVLVYGTMRKLQPTVQHNGQRTGYAYHRSTTPRRTVAPHWTTPQSMAILPHPHCVPQLSSPDPGNHFWRRTKRQREPPPTGVLMYWSDSKWSWCWWSMVYWWVLVAKPVAMPAVYGLGAKRPLVVLRWWGARVNRGNLGMGGGLVGVGWCDQGGVSGWVEANCLGFEEPLFGQPSNWILLLWMGPCSKYQTPADEIDFQCQLFGDWITRKKCWLRKNVKAFYLN